MERKTYRDATNPKKKHVCQEALDAQRAYNERTRIDGRTDDIGCHFT